MIEQLIPAIEASLGELSSLLRTFSAEPTIPLRPNEWSARDVAAHMLQVEIECHWQRTQRIGHGENPHYRYYYNTKWDFGTQDLDTSLDEWAAWRHRVIALARRLSPKQLKLTGTHDHFGTITVLDVLRIAHAHDQEHIEDLKKLRSENCSAE